MSMDLSGFVRKRTKIKLGTKEFTFAELLLGDLAEFRAHLMEKREKLNAKRRERLIKSAKEIPNVDPLELLKLVDSEISEEEFERELESVEGIGFLAYLSLRYAHAEISQGQAMIIITPNNIVDITNALFPKVKEEEKTTESKKKRSSSRK